MGIIWKYKFFDELTVAELYNILQIRSEVFVVEQNCIYQDADNKDDKSFHLLGFIEETLVAYCRILPPGISFSAASIGRVLTSPKYRKFGYGKQLMQLAVKKTLLQFSCAEIIIGAQLYLKTFYESIGFVQISPTYLEDNIPHIEMKFST